MALCARSVGVNCSDVDSESFQFTVFDTNRVTVYCFTSETLQFVKRAPVVVPVPGVASDPLRIQVRG